MPEFDGMRVNAEEAVALARGVPRKSASGVARWLLRDAPNRNEPSQQRGF